MKVARTVLSGGKLEKAYLSQFAFSTISQLGYMVMAVGQTKAYIKSFYVLGTPKALNTCS